MSLGKNIYRLRTGRGLSQGDLAEALQVSRQSISKWETDGATPDLDKLLALSDLFGVTLDDLVRGEAPELHPVTTPDRLTAADAPAAQPASGESSGLKTVLIVILVILGLWLLFSLFMSPSLWPGLLVLVVIGGFGFALWTRVKESPKDQADPQKHTSGKRQLLIIALIISIPLLAIFGLASSLPAGPVYAKAGKESTLTPQDYPGMRFASNYARQDSVSYALVNETGETMSYDARAQRIEVKKNGKWYQLKKRTDSESNFSRIGTLQPGKTLSIWIDCKEVYGSLAAGEYRVLLKVYPLTDVQNAQWIAATFKISNGLPYQLPS